MPPKQAPAEVLQHERQDELVRAARRTGAQRPPAMEDTTGRDVSTTPTVGEEAGGIIIATGTTAVGTAASG